MPNYAAANSRSLNEKLGEHKTFLDAVTPAQRTAVRDGTNADDLGPAIQALIDEVASLGGGRIYVPYGTYLVSGLVFPNDVPIEIVGDGPGISIIKLLDGTNGDLITNANFATLTCSNAVGGVFRCALRHLTLDGNKDNQTGTSYGLRWYGHGFYLDDIVVQNCLTDGIYTEYAVDTAFTAPGDDLECYCSDVKAMFNGRHGWRYHGPHDGVIRGFVAYNNDGWNWINESSYGQVNVAGTAVTYVAFSGHPFTDDMTQINIAGTVYPFTYVSETSGTIVGSLTVTGAAFHAFNGGGLHLKDFNTFLGTLGGMKVCDAIHGENIAGTTATGQGMLITADSGAVHIKNGIFASSADVGLAIHNSNNVIDGLVANSLVGVYIAGGFTQLKVNFFSCTTFLSYGPGPFNWDIIEANGTLPVGGTLVSGTAPIYGIYKITAIQNSLPITFIRYPQIVDVLGTLKVGLVSEDGKLLLFSDNGSGSGVNYIQSVSGDETARRDLTVASVNSEPIALMKIIAKQFQIFNSNTTDTVGTRTTQVILKNGADNVGNVLSPFVVLSNAGATIAEIHPNGDIVTTQDLIGNRVVVANTGAILYRSSANLVIQLTTGAWDFFSTTLGNSALLLSNLGDALFAGPVGVQGTSARIYSGSGDPESSVTAVVGSLYLRRGGAAGTTLYIKETGTGNTGWVTVANYWLLVSAGNIRSNNNVGIKKDPSVELDVNGVAQATTFRTGLTASRPLRTTTNGDIAIGATALNNSNEVSVSGLTTGAPTKSDGSKLASMTASDVRTFADVFSKTESNTLFAALDNVYTKAQIDTMLAGYAVHPHTHPFTGGGHSHGVTTAPGTTDSASDSGTTGADS